jgi:hypothetical protein
MGDNRKMHNKNCDNARTALKVRQERKWKLHATNVANKINP